MTFKDIYNYNIEDLLKIDTTKFVYSAYVLYKDKDNIFIEYQVPIVKREFYNRYNNKELKIENSKIIKIDPVSSHILAEENNIFIFPAKHFITNKLLLWSLLCHNPLLLFPAEFLSISFLPLF